VFQTEVSDSSHGSCGAVGAVRRLALVISTGKIRVALHVDAYVVPDKSIDTPSPVFSSDSRSSKLFSLARIV
jgi:hypothetical protein